MDLNAIDAERVTAFDWALGNGELTRRRFLSSVSESPSPIERKQAIEVGSIFGNLPNHESARTFVSIVLQS